jgi:hypothetical protein
MEGSLVRTNDEYSARGSLLNLIANVFAPITCVVDHLGESSSIGVGSFLDPLAISLLGAIHERERESQG